MLFLNIGWKWDSSFLSLFHSLKYASHPAWGSVHITKSNEVLVIAYSKTGCPLRLTGNINRTMRFGPSVPQKPRAGFCCCFLQRQSNLWKTDVSEIHHVKLQESPGNPHHFCALKQMCTLSKWFHCNTVKWEFWGGLNIEHCRYWHKGSVWPLMTEDSVFVHSCLTPTVFCTEVSSILSKFLCLYNTL